MRRLILAIRWWECTFVRCSAAADFDEPCGTCEFGDGVFAAAVYRRCACGLHGVRAKEDKHAGRAWDSDQLNCAEGSRGGLRPVSFPLAGCRDSVLLGLGATPNQLRGRPAWEKFFFRCWSFSLQRDSYLSPSFSGKKFPKCAFSPCAKRKSMLQYARIEAFERAGGFPPVRENVFGDNPDDELRKEDFSYAVRLL